MHACRSTLEDPTQFALQLQDEDGLTCAEVIQSVKLLSHPTKELKNLVLQERIAHGGNPVLRWMAENCQVITDSNDNERVNKKKSAKRVDGVSATINALCRSIAEVDQTSVYETGGIKSL